MDIHTPSHQTTSLSLNGEEDMVTLHDNTSASSIGGTTIGQAGTRSRDSELDISPSYFPSDETSTHNGLGRAAELPSLDNYKRLKRSKSIASSLKVRDGYDTGLWYRFSYWATEIWFYDFFAWLISCYCFAGIVITLVLHRDQPIPEWPLNITVNALVSALSTIMGSTLLVPVSNAIGQSKWSWIEKDRRKLEDIAIYDEASRGPWGSLVLLLRKGFRGPVALGALITICVLPIAPMLQQTTAVISVKLPVENAIATLYGLNWWAEGLRTESGLPRIKDKMVVAINRGLFFDGNFSDPFSVNSLLPRPQCQTGNCSFGVFESLAICSECKDISKFLTMQIDDDGRECGAPQLDGPYPDCARWTLPNGHDSGWVNFTNGLLLSTNASRDPILLRAGLPILNLTAIAPCWTAEYSGGGAFHHRPCADKDEWRRNAQAQECNPQWCTNTYHSETTNGVLEEKVISSIRQGQYAPGTMYDFSPQNKSLTYRLDLGNFTVDPRGGFDYESITTGTIRGKLSVHRQASDLVSAYLKSEFEGFATKFDANSIRGRSGNSNIRRLYMANLGGFKNGTITQYFDMSPLFETMALSMTSVLRTETRVPTEEANDAATPIGAYRPNQDSWDLPTQWQPINTAPDRLVPVLRVNWAWITLPAILELFTLLLLCYMVSWKSQRLLPVWKSSTLPLLLLGSEMHDTIGENVPRHIVDMRELAKEVSIEPNIAMGRSKQPIVDEMEDVWASDETRGHESKEELSLYR